MNNQLLRLKRRYLERIEEKIEDDRLTVGIFFNGTYFLKITSVISKNSLIIVFNEEFSGFTLSYFYDFNGIDTNTLTFAESLYPKDRPNSHYDFNTTMVKGLLIPILLNSKIRAFDTKSIFQKLTPGEFEFIQTERHGNTLKVLQNGFTFSVLLIQNSSIFEGTQNKLIYKEYTDTFDIHRMAEIVRTKKILV